LERIHVLPNPVVNPDLFRLAREIPHLPSLLNAREPLILGVGRLVRQKDFPTLLRAFTIVRQQRPVRLIILGEGPERPILESLIKDLGVQHCVSLPGFVENPYAYMSRATVFVLSSRWEGLPSVLIQALACGTTVIATDCESGPREILGDGRYGALVPIADVSAMATAIVQVLDTPRSPPPSEAWERFTEDASVAAYLRLLSS
jgi:glycosyltransferase involved in cell wall biosynthesis